jgi:predicted  nucleic acid-binding Zn-ribbon protein
MDQDERALKSEIRALREELKARTDEIEDLKTRIETQAESICFLWSTTAGAGRLRWPGLVRS